MADVPLPEPDGVVAAMWNVVRHGPNFDGRQKDVIAAAKAYAERHAAAFAAAKDKEIAQLRAELLKSLADNAALRADAIDRQNNVVAPLRERVRVLEDARPEPDCRTCKHMMHRHFRITCGAEPCTNGNRYQELPPVRLWRTAP